jgi:hypothetical protein
MDTYRPGSGNREKHTHAPSASCIKPPAPAHRNFGPRYVDKCLALS